MLARRRFLLACLAFIAATTLSQPKAHALICADDTWGELIAHSDVIFRGRLISQQFLIERAPTAPDRHPPQDYWYGDFIVHTFETLDVLKGDVGIVVQVYERISCGMCNLGIEPGQTFLVIARREGERLVTGACSGVQEDADGAHTHWLAEQMRAWEQR